MKAWAYQYCRFGCSIANALCETAEQPTFLFPVFITSADLHTPHSFFFCQKGISTSLYAINSSNRTQKVVTK